MAKSLEQPTDKGAMNPLAAVHADVFIFGTPVWNPTYETFKSWWESFIGSSERSAHTICLANAFTFNLTSRNLEFRECVRSMTAVLNDGMGYRIASSSRGVRTHYNFNGTDLIPRLLEELTSPLRVFFYGATEAVNEEAVRKLSAKYPYLEVAGRINGFVKECEALQAIAQSNADVLLVAMGHPKQELFMIHNQKDLNVKAVIGCGGFFDFISGSKPRAPKKVRDWGFEWVFRLAIEPKRMFRRYVIGNPVFLIRCFWYLRRDLKLKRASEQTSSIRSNASSKTVSG